ncbi:hypothetical protein RCL_jg16180.t1 [Rhizophagus clarus]|uniref:Uncharacterized protein n=1 Tax=Rhizophagus clarus TaxID=94130 RepID=A0A8H3R1S8_9GLOM|nr:hypothetical protein RCL_jg16180.t1 [Rhizophagus clarus]
MRRDPKRTKPARYPFGEPDKFSSSPRLSNISASVVLASRIPPSDREMVSEIPSRGFVNLSTLMGSEVKTPSFSMFLEKARELVKIH